MGFSLNFGMRPACFPPFFAAMYASLGDFARQLSQALLPSKEAAFSAAFIWRLASAASSMLSGLL
jgi:hypothetical protein